MPRRLHPRVRLRLPVRLRWVAPLGQKTEQCETRNASRGGLLLACQEHHGVGMPLWVTFPYDPAFPDGQPEVLARVTRCEEKPHDGDKDITVAIHFEGGMKTASGPGSRVREMPSSQERRPLALQIRVRPERVPWFEEAMTLDVSSDTLRFVTNRVYSAGDALRVSFAVADSSPWRATGEQAARVTQIEHLSDSNSLVVTVHRLPS